MYHISISCDLLPDPCLFRAICLVAFFGFLRMSHIAPHSSKKFDPSIHILRQDLYFPPPGVHITLKWSKTLQGHKAYHVVLLPQLANIYLCPVRALHQLLLTRPFPPSAPLFQVSLLLTVKLLTLSSEMPWNLFSQLELFPLSHMDSTLSGAWGPLLPLTTMPPSKI